MPFSKAQKKLLDKLSIPEELQQPMATELGEEGRPKNDRDFLLVISDHLQSAEKILHTERLKLAERQKENRGANTEVLEDKIKTRWIVTSSLWQVADELIRHPADYGVVLELKQVRSILEKKNLTILELIKWARPDFFEMRIPNPMLQALAGLISAIIGAILGLIGGFFGGMRQGWLPHPLMGFILFIIYAIGGMVTGIPIGILFGARYGFQTGNIMVGCKLGFYSAYLNPFHFPRGTVEQQAVQFEVEEALFQLAEEKRLR